MSCATGENFEISSISIEKNNYFIKVWGTYMLRVCLGILKNLPQYAYDLYAYKKNVHNIVYSKLSEDFLVKGINIDLASKIQGIIRLQNIMFRNSIRGGHKY